MIAIITTSPDAISRKVDWRARIYESVTDIRKRNGIAENHLQSAVPASVPFL